MAAVLGELVEPLASLSLSKPLEPLWSAFWGIRAPIANWTWPLNPLSESKSSSIPAKAIKCLAFTVPPNHSYESSPEYETWTWSIKVLRPTE